MPEANKSKKKERKIGGELVPPNYTISEELVLSNDQGYFSTESSYLVVNPVSVCSGHQVGKIFVSFTVEGHTTGLVIMVFQILFSWR